MDNSEPEKPRSRKWSIVTAVILGPTIYSLVTKQGAGKPNPLIPLLVLIGSVALLVAVIIIRKRKAGADTRK